VRPAPVPDRDGQPWWDGLARHELLVQRCGACGRLRWPPRAMCGECGGLLWEWHRASGRATVASWVVNHHPFSDAFPVPYVVVTGRLAEQDDILIPARFDDDNAGAGASAALAVGAALAAGFEDVGEFTGLVWRLGTG
jgi:uncharacterized OB-fold protein